MPGQGGVQEGVVRIKDFGDASVALKEIREELDRFSYIALRSPTKVGKWRSLFSLNSSNP
jgi:hypothetical protein